MEFTIKFNDNNTYDTICEKLASKCNSVNECPVSKLPFPCPLVYILNKLNCYKVTPEDWKQALKPVDEHND